MLMPRSIWLLLILVAAPILRAEKMVVEVYPLDLADFETASQLAAAMVSKEAKLVSDKENNRLIVYDFPERQAALRKALMKVSAPANNVRIQVAFKDQSSLQQNSAGVEGRFRAGGVTVGTSRSTVNGVNVHADQVNVMRDSNVQQELIVVSGGKAKLRVGTDLPYADWFWSYGIQQGLWNGGVKWKEVGAQMIVEPYVIGGKIRVRLTPEFSYVVDGKTLATAIEKLTTEVIVDDGQEISLGGLPVSDSEFFSRFLIGYDHAGEKRSLHITLKPTIEPATRPMQQ